MIGNLEILLAGCLGCEAIGCSSETPGQICKAFLQNFRCNCLDALQLRLVLHLGTDKNMSIILYFLI
jgi:hypothetical protein